MCTTMVSSEEQAPGGLPPSSGGFEESLAYLLVFSEALLDLVPDPVGVLDADLRVRNANEAFAGAFGFPSAQAIRQTSLADHPLLRAPYTGRPEASLAEALRGLAEGIEEKLEIQRVEIVGPDGTTAAWKLRASGWDTEDPAYRRVLVWCHPVETVVAPPPAPEPIAEPSLPVDAAPVPPPEEIPLVRASGNGLSKALLERLPIGACVLDPTLRVRVANRLILDVFGRTLGPDDAEDRHVFSVFPELYDAELLPLLETCRDEGSPIGGTLTVTRPDGSPARFEIEVQPIGGAVDEQRELLLLFHEVEGMIPSLATSETQPPISGLPTPAQPPVAGTTSPTDTQLPFAGTPAPTQSPVTEAPAPTETQPVAGALVPEAPLEIVDSARLTRWPAATTDRVLLVEADSWTRMTIADSLRGVGLTDLATCDSGAEAWARHDPAFFALTIVGLDAEPDDAQEFCARMTREAARVPVLAITEGSIERARALVGSFPLAGILALSAQSREVGTVAVAIARRGNASTAPPESPASPTPERPAAAPKDTSSPANRVDVVILGARESDVAALNLLHRAPGVRVRLVYDSEPDALGLEVAQSLGVPTISGNATLALDPPPAFVVVARKGLESVLERLQLHAVPRVARDEIELFAADPEAFLRTESAATEPAPAETPKSNSPAPIEAYVESVPVATPHVPIAEPSHELTRALDAEMARLSTPPPLPAASEPALAPFATGPAAEPSFFDLPLERSPDRAAQTSASRTAPVDAPPVVAKESTPPRPPSGEWNRASDNDERVGGPLDLVALTGAFDLLFDFDRLCRRGLDLAITSVRGASGSLMLLDEDGRTLRIVAAVGLSDLVVRETRQRVGEGIAGRVADDAEPLLLVGTIGDERFPVRGERPEIPSAVCAPIMAEGRVLGVLNVNSEPTHEPFDQPEVHRLATWARQVGPAIDRSRQLQQVRGRSFELSVRGAIESIASSGEDLITRLRRVAARATELLNVDSCAIWLHEPKTERLVLRALGGASAAMDALSTPLGVGLVGWVAKNRRPLVLRHSPDDPSDIEALRVACAAVPIRHHTDLVGVLTVESTSGTAMDQTRLALLATVAGVVGEQVGSSRAQASSEHMVTMLSALSELGVAFGAARERRSLGRLVAFTAATVLESDVSTVRLLREGVLPGASDVESYDLLASHGAQPAGPDDPLTELEERVAREVLARRAGVTDADFPAREAASLLTRSNVAALLATPLMSEDDELLGVVVVYRVADTRSRDVPYGEPEREIAARLGDYAAAAAQRFSTRRGPEADL